MLSAVGTSVVGPTHAEAGEPCQDASAVRGWRGGWIVCVADGLGSRPQSGRGARCAAQVAMQVLRRELDHRRAARELATQIYRAWLRAVGPDRADGAATTLLIAACNAKGQVRTWQLGDGMVLIRSQGEVRALTPPRSGFGNETRALGIDRAWSAWSTHEFELSRVGDMVVLMTDGVADDIDARSLPTFPQALHRRVSGLSRRRARRWLTHELTHWGTPGHSDDKSLALIFKKGS
ncbi:PP2C family serine/threonine-protein phosphatase [Leptothrix sp. BB-4]